MPGMISCKKATELTEKRLITGLTMKDRFGLFFHLMICRSCRVYSQQSKRIDSFLKSLDEKKAYPTMNAELKNRIKQRLNEEITR